MRAEVVQIHGFSAHADQNELLRLLDSAKQETGAVYLVHGEQEQRSVLADKLRAAGFARVELAEAGQRVQL